MLEALGQVYHQDRLARERGLSRIEAFALSPATQSASNERATPMVGRGGLQRYQQAVALLQEVSHNDGGYMKLFAHRRRIIVAPTYFRVMEEGRTSSVRL